ncbi:MAG: hypothetical protein M0Q21_12430 [Ignavibacteriaceae bacterium]|nr:hypothetical protein [Ignavibacteriaceae bacterium]
MPSREINLEDQFIIARTSKRLVVLAVDSVAGVYELERHQVVDAEEVFLILGKFLNNNTD